MLGRDSFFVPRVQDAKAWYQDVLGEEPAFDSPGYCSFHLAGASVGIHPSDEKTAAGVAGQVAYWRVSDIHKVMAHFETHGCRLFRGPIYGIDGVWVCQMMDPFGNLWGFMESNIAVRPGSP